MIALWIIIFSVIVAGSEIDIIVASFPSIRSYFNISPFMVEFALGINILFHCIAAFICGSLGDKFGKKITVLYGFVIFIIGSLIAALSNKFFWLLFGRALQGVGVAPAMVLSFLIALENSKPEEKQKILGIVNGFSTLAIATAPAVGSYVNYYFGWNANFWLLLVLGIAVFILFFIYIPKDKNINNAVSLNIEEYLILLKNKTVFLYIIVLCFVIGAYYTFVGLSSILYIEALKVNPKDFGIYQGALTFTFGIFSIISGSVVKFFGKKKSFFISLAFILAFIVCNFLMSIFNPGPLAITLSMLLLSVGFVIPCNVLFGLAIESFSGASGRISALISSIKWIVSAIGVQVTSFFYNDSYFALGICITIMVTLSFIFGIFLWKNDQNLRMEVLN